MKPLVSICIPTLDADMRLLTCIRSIRQTCAHINHEILISDNGDRPRGYVGPVNQMLRAAKGKYRVAFNDDIVCRPGWLDALLHAAQSLPEAYVVFPDQRSTDSPGGEEQCLCGWCLMFTPRGFDALGGFDDRYVLWASDIDLAKRCHMLGQPPVRVSLPVPLAHDLNVTIGRADFRDFMSPTGMSDIDAYNEKWRDSSGLGDCLKDKFRLKPAVFDG